MFGGWFGGGAGSSDSLCGVTATGISESVAGRHRTLPVLCARSSVSCRPMGGEVELSQTGIIQVSRAEEAGLLLEGGGEPGGQ